MGHYVAFLLAPHPVCQRKGLQEDGTLVLQAQLQQLLCVDVGVGDGGEPYAETTVCPLHACVLRVGYVLRVCGHWGLTHWPIPRHFHGPLPWDFT